MGSRFGRLPRLVSPFTLLIGALLFLLPFCAVACNGPLGGGNNNLITATGVNLATGAEVTPDCTVLNQAESALGSGIANSLGGSASASATNQGSSCSSSSTSTSSGGLGAIPGGNPISGAAASGSLGPFAQSTQAGQVHVDRQPLAIAALALFVVGAAVAVFRRRITTLMAALAALAAAGCLIALRITLNSSFNDDLKKAAAASSGTSSTLGLDPTTLFSLSWGLGWTLALVAAILATGINLGALGLPRLGQGRAPSGGSQPASEPAPPPGYAGYPSYPSPPAQTGYSSYPPYSSHPGYPAPDSGTPPGSSPPPWVPAPGSQAGQGGPDAPAPEDR